MIKGDTRVKIIDFFKRNIKKIVIIFLVWLIIFIINYFLGKRNNKGNGLITDYNVHEAIQTETTVPNKLIEPIENLIDQFVGYCNNKEYENAYNLLDGDCKEEFYPTLDDFKKYVDSVYDEPKIYTIKNYSNVKDIYIYRVRIMDDIFAKGMDRNDTYFDEEYFVIKKLKGDKLNLSIRGFIQKETLNKIYEDDYIRVNVESKTTKYKLEEYNVRITNKSEHIILLSDLTKFNDIEIEVGNSTRSLYTDITTAYNKVILYPQESIRYEFAFQKFFDEYRQTESLKFNNIRVLNHYTGAEITEDSKEVEKIYSTSIKLN